MRTVPGVLTTADCLNLLNASSGCSPAASPRFVFGVSRTVPAAENRCFQFSVSRNPTDGDLCRGGGNATFQCVAFRMTNC